jgi:hypothetical protein
MDDRDFHHARLSRARLAPNNRPFMSVTSMKG